MEITNSFEVPLSLSDTWKVLMDIRRIVPCMPGAALIEQSDERTFKGTVAVKLGPVALTFLGTAQFEEIDEERHRARVKAQGNDAKGRGGANATVNFQLAEAPAGTRVDVLTQVALSGAVAQYGRGVGIIQSVATELVGQFASRLRATLANDGRSGAPVVNEARESSTSPPFNPISAFSLVRSVVWGGIKRLFGRE